MMAVVPPACVRSVTDPAAQLTTGGDGAEDAQAAVSTVGDLPLSTVCAQLFGGATT
jgi:hypothetical protein